MTDTHLPDAASRLLELELAQDEQPHPDLASQIALMAQVVLPLCEPGDRRNTLRIPVPNPRRVTFDTGVGELVDVSRHGMKISTTAARAFTAGEKLTVELYLEDGTPIEAHVRVQRVGLTGIGLAFDLDCSATARRRHTRLYRDAYLRYLRALAD